MHVVDKLPYRPEPRICERGHNIMHVLVYLWTPLCCLYNRVLARCPEQIMLRVCRLFITKACPVNDIKNRYVFERRRQHRIRRMGRGPGRRCDKRRSTQSSTTISRIRRSLKRRHCKDITNTLPEPFLAHNYTNHAWRKRNATSCVAGRPTIPNMYREYQHHQARHTITTPRPDIDTQTQHSTRTSSLANTQTARC